MPNNNFNKVVESLRSHFLKAEHICVSKPVTLKHDMSIDNRLLVIHSGNITIENNNKQYKLEPGGVYLISSYSSVDINYGETPTICLDKANLKSKLENYFLPVSVNTSTSYSENGVFSVIHFKLYYGAVEFFRFLKLPFFSVPMKDSHMFPSAIRSMLEESQAVRIGKFHLLNSLIDVFVTLLLRRIVEKKMFLKEIGLKIDALTDRRIVHIFNYIEENIKGDLSNRAIANQLNVSPDYVGQVFAKAVGIPLQTNVSSKRMMKAIELLTQNKRVGEVAQNVGYRDLAYFCRKFKTTFGASAKQVQKRLVNDHYNPATLLNRL